MNYRIRFWHNLYSELIKFCINDGGIDDSFEYPRSKPIIEFERLDYSGEAPRDHLFKASFYQQLNKVVFLVRTTTEGLVVDLVEVFNNEIELYPEKASDSEAIMKIFKDMSPAILNHMNDIWV